MRVPEGPVFIYVDDLTIFSSTFAEHLMHLRAVFTRAREYSLQFKLSKAQFLRAAMRILGSIIKPNGTVMPDPQKTNALVNMPYPKNVNEVRVFLGMINYYRRFILACAEHCTSLQHLLRKGVDFNFSDECKQSFDYLRNSLLDPKVLVQPDRDQPFILATDASDYAVGAVLSQMREGVEHPVAFFSKSLLPVECRWAAVEKEVFAIVAAVKFYRHYLLGNHFTLYTDCQALTWALRLTAPAGKLARWTLLLQEYSYDVQHRMGIKNQNADNASQSENNSRTQHIIPVVHTKCGGKCED